MFPKMNFGSSMERLEEVSMEEWNDRLQQVHPTRADMNKLVMNYLVTGMNNNHVGHHQSGKIDA